MVTHRIDLTNAANGKAYFEYKGERLGLSNSPIFAAARKLIERGLAFPDDEIATFRGEMKCLSSRVGVAARLTVDESGGGVYFVRYRTPEEKGLRQKGLQHLVIAAA